MEKKLNANHLKLIAILAMTVDHAADLLFPGFPVEPVAVVLHLITPVTGISKSTLIRAKNQGA